MLVRHIEIAAVEKCAGRARRMRQILAPSPAVRRARQPKLSRSTASRAQRAQAAQLGCMPGAYDTPETLLRDVDSQRDALRLRCRRTGYADRLRADRFGKGGELLRDA